ncbi:unnamed protein product, partial [Gulo gulo]
MKTMIIPIYEGPTWFHAPCRMLSCGLSYLLSVRFLFYETRQKWPP